MQPTKSPEQRESDGARFRAAIRTAGYESQAAFARQLASSAIGEVQVSRWANGVRPHRLTRRLLARRLGVPEEEIWPDELPLPDPKELAQEAARERQEQATEEALSRVEEEA